MIQCILYSVSLYLLFELHEIFHYQTYHYHVTIIIHE